MVFSNNLLMGAAAAAASGGAGYVPKGAIWLDGSTNYLMKTFGSAGNRKTFTYSFWWKRVGIGTDQYVMTAGDSNTSYMWYIPTTDLCQVNFNTSTAANFISNGVFRDPTAWQHVCVMFDTTVPTYQVWINGQIPSKGTNNLPTSDQEHNFMNSGVEHRIGSTSGEPSSCYEGYLSEFIVLDGYAGFPTDFGQFNDDGVWVPIDPSSVVSTNKGTNGFWLDFADSADLGNDVSGNNNDFDTYPAPAMAATNWTYDRPADSDTTGNFCTFTSQYRREVDVGYYVYTPRGVVDFGQGGKEVKWTGGSSAGTYGVNVIINSTVPLYPGNKYHVEWKTTRWGVPASSGAYQAVYLVPVSYYSNYVNLNSSGSGSYTFYTSSWNPSKGTNGQAWFNGSSISTTITAFPLNETMSLDIDMSTIGSTTIIEKRYNSGSPATDFTASSLAFLDEPYFICSQCQGNGSGRDFDALFNFGDTGTWLITPETDHVGVNTYTINKERTITKPSDNFLPILYEGNGTGQRVGNFIPFTDSHTVDHSARFDEGSTQYMTRSTWGTSTDTTKWSLSMWVKRGNPGKQRLVDAGSNLSNQNIIEFTAADLIDFQLYVAPNFGRVTTYRKLTQSDGWVNLVFVHDSGNSTAADRMRIYVNGVRDTTGTATNPSGNLSLMTINGQNTTLAYDLINTSNPYDGYMAEVVFLDGIATTDASQFGETDTSTNRWIPKDVSGLTFGTNGFYLNMADKNDLGDDESGNGNDFTMTNMDTTNGSNQMYDTPTRNTAVISGGFAASTAELTQGNLTLGGSSGDPLSSPFTIQEVSSGKWYFEGRLDAIDTSTGGPSMGFALSSALSNSTNTAASPANYYTMRIRGGPSIQCNNDGVTWQPSNAPTVAVGTVYGLFIDCDNGKAWGAVDGTIMQNSAGDSVGSPSAGTNPTFLFPNNTAITFFAGGSNAGDITINTGAWIYFDGAATTLDSDAGGYFQSTSIPTGFKALNQDNLPENTAGITGFAWFKERDGITNNLLWDRVNGIYKYIISNTNDVQGTDANGLQRFLQQGAQVGDMSSINDDGDSMVLWQWVAGGTSTPSVNTDAGFSIAKYTGNGSAGNTVTHSLGVAPEFICVKKLAAGDDATNRHWAVYHVSEGNTKYGLLSDGNAFGTSSGYWNNTTPGTSTFTVGTDDSVNGNNAPYVAYCWAGVEGYSKFGSYFGNGDNDGITLYLGFRPSYVLIKDTGAAATNWNIFDDQRDPYNPITQQLLANSTSAEATQSARCDFLAQGIKFRVSTGDINNSGNSFIYAAFAENPFGGSGVAQAKAR